jgi:hypothetical protein
MVLPMYDVRFAEIFLENMKRYDDLARIRCCIESHLHDAEG